MRIGAPAQNSAGWHSLENDGSRQFRWTESAETVLGEYAFVEGINYIALSVIMAIEPGFLNTSSLRIGPDIVPLAGNIGKISAQYTSPVTRRFWVSLLTPQPIKPCIVNRDSPDQRELGLALLI